MSHFFGSFLSAIGFILGFLAVGYVIYLWRQHVHDKEVYENERANEMADKARALVERTNNADLIASINGEYEKSSDPTKKR